MDEVGWLNDYTVYLEYSEQEDMSQAETRMISDYHQKTFTIERIYANVKFCLTLKKKTAVKQFCEVSFCI